MRPVDVLAETACRVLCVDDSPTIRMLVREALEADGCVVTEAESGERGLLLTRKEPFDVVLLDVNMPGLDGLTVCKEIRQHAGTRLLPIIVLTTLDTTDDIIDVMESGANEFMAKPFEPGELKARVATAAKQKRITDTMEDAETVLRTMAQLVEARDRSTGEHCERLAHMASVFGQRLALSANEMRALNQAAYLHDVGKIVVPDSILNKPGPLTPAERNVMETHPVIGATLCSPLRTIDGAVVIVRHHHEKWNGSGYPDGLAGEDIPYLARVFQVLDVYDALASERPYKRAWPVDRINTTMRQETDDGFWDSELMGAFLDILNTQPESLVFHERRNPTSTVSSELTESTGRS